MQLTSDHSAIDAEVRDLVGEIHRSPLRCVVILAGAGSEALSGLLGAPGASRTLLEAIVPYSRASLLDLLGRLPTSLASPEAAEQMADAAYARALALSDGDYPVAGLACAAAILSDRPRRGRHRAHVAVRTEDGRTALGVVMEKGLRDRAGEEAVASLMLLRAAALAAGLDRRVDLRLSSAEQLVVDRRPGVDGHPIDLLMSGAVDWVHVSEDGAMACEPGIGGALMPGSFNPLHRGHIELRGAAQRVLGMDVTFELSISNVDKPTLTKREVEARLGTLRGRSPVVLTRASRFSQKSRLFPATTFVVGYDTAARIVEPSYYGGDREELSRSLGRVGAAGCRFLVAGREVEGEFRSLDDLNVPVDFEALFDQMPETVFRWDVSSSVIRAGLERESQ